MNIKFNDKKEWLNLRTQGIGGSEISAIIGKNEHHTKFDIWLKKTGRYTENFTDKQIDDMERGNWLEVPLLEWFANKTNIEVIHNTDLYISDINSILRCTPDGFTRDGFTPKALIEVKSTKLYTKDANISWFIQGQWNLGVTGYDKLIIIWIDGNLERQYETYDRNNGFIKFLQEEAIKFWEEYVLTDMPPDPATSSDVLKMYDSHIPEKSYNLDDFNNLSALIELRKQIKLLEEREMELIEKFKIQMLDAELLTYNNKVYATWKTQISNRFDTEKFKKEQGELYKQYIKQTNSRVFRFK